MKYNYWTQEEINFVRKCRKKGMKYREIGEKLELIYGRKAHPSNIARFCTKPKAKKGGIHWTPEEIERLIELRREQGLTYREIGLRMGRTTRSVQNKYQKFEKGLNDVVEQIREEVKTHGVAVSIPEMKEKPTPEPKEKKWANNRCNYTPQQELGIMVDFPNLSIDEMREKYQRDYRALAGRYEEIWDSEEPSRIALVMEASQIVAARKREEAETASEPRMGWFERRKMRRVARKAAKIQKRLDRMATKYGAILTNGDE
jgi:hypothetical protein